MFRTDLLSIIRSLITVFTAIGICHRSYVDCLLAFFYVLLTVNLSITLGMTNLTQNCFILYVYYSLLHVSSKVLLIIRRSYFLLIQHLVWSLDFIWIFFNNC